MSLSDCKNGSNTPRLHNHLHSLHIAENYAKRPVRTFLDFRDTNVAENLDIRHVPMLFFKNLQRISKIKVVSFLLGLTLTFFIMASYVLMWDKKGPLFTPSPYQLRPAAIPTSTTATRASSKKNPVNVKVLVKLIKQEYTPRKVPDEKDVIATDSHLFSVIPRRFLPGIKSPCWYEEFSSKPGNDLYRKNLFTLRSKSFKTVCDRLRANFHKHLYHKDGKDFRLRCLPYFYIIGQPKCGTTDLFHRMLLHPEVKFNIMKEPHWWTRKRFGYIRFKDGFQESFRVEDYLDLFDMAAHSIQEGITGNSSGHHRCQCASNGRMSWLFTSHFVPSEQPNNCAFLLPVDLLFHFVARLYSDYLYFKTANKSAEDFHQKVIESVQLFQSCVSEWSLRSCTYNTSLFNDMPVRLNLGMYIVFLLDWLSVFSKEQILVLRLEDYAANLKETIQKVFDFLSVGPVSQQVEAALTKQPMSNTRREEDRSLGPMLPATRNILRNFHQPFNRKLASLLDNEAFLWNNS
uniref:Sulfotransferase n=1 Tax=Neolamprologus brichardi TaxID=32507 RepID=A0A3Q4HK19_NEOBR